MGREDAARAVEPGVQRRADNKVAIAKEEGALAALVALVRNGSAVGKENAAGTLKSLSRITEIKNSLLHLGCPVSALA